MAEAQEDTEVREELDAGTPEAVETDVAPEADPAPEPQEEARSLSSFGLPHDDPEEVSRHFRSMQQQLQQAQQWQQYLAYQQSQQAQKPAEPEKPKLPWEIPEFDMRLMDQLTQDENGNLVAKPGALPTIPQDYRAFTRAREDAINKFLRDPYGTLKDGIMPMVQEQAQQIAYQMLHQHEMQRKLQDYDQKYAQVYKNPDGSLNEFGQQFNQHFHQAVQMGHRDPVGYADMAMQAAFFGLTAQQQAAQEAKKAEPSAAEKRMAYLKNAATRSPNRGGPTNGRNRIAAKNGEDAFKKLQKKWESRKANEFMEDGRFKDEEE